MKNMELSISKVERVEIAKWTNQSDIEMHGIEIRVFSEGEEFLLELNSSGVNGPEIAFVDKD